MILSHKTVTNGPDSPSILLLKVATILCYLHQIRLLLAPFLPKFSTLQSSNGQMNFKSNFDRSYACFSLLQTRLGGLWITPTCAGGSLVGSRDLLFPVLSGAVLDDLTKNIENEMKSKVMGKFATSQRDGWKNIAKTSLIASMINVEYVVSSFNTLTEQYQFLIHPIAMAIEHSRHICSPEDRRYTS